MAAKTQKKKTVKRKRRSGTMQARGVKRRERITSAAKELLLKKNLEDISYNEIAETAKVPAGSAYHFFPNVNSIYAAIAMEFLQRYVSAIAAPANKDFHTWQDVIDKQIEQGAKLFQEDPAAMKIIIGGKTPPEIKHWDRENDRRIAEMTEQDIKRYFQLPEIPRANKVFFYYVEIVDLIFSLSVLEHGTIAPHMVHEAQVAGKSYLSNYIPNILSKA
ncbi:TetR/AcrR family transcriptional regulator [Hyphococcus flavus]|uniref:TetR/AcrR family transcriptional regulator n=1 Tax=Hyphococcus flavus TaxID=1866326 RepID=A0AAF0CFY8_9PROT|nr:TetR/AcrR family transcriptional regulator [Hyphococcus flavus]WDI30102.1 TetR/AcrR family transcriptional regulator [Hyphococcus flavus]